LKDELRNLKLAVEKEKSKKGKKKGGKKGKGKKGKGKGKKKGTNTFPLIKCIP
jgi:hypothetical protein